MGRKTEEEEPTRAKRQKKSKAAIVESDDEEAPAARQAGRGKAPDAGIADKDRLAEMTSHYASVVYGEGQSTGLTPREEDQLVRIVMRFMLFRQMQKPGIPVKRDELGKVIPSTYKSQKIHNLFRVVVTKAQERFPPTFGMEMREVGGQQGGDGPKMYLLRSLLKAELRDLLGTKELQISQGFTMTVLSIILLAGGRLSDDDLVMHLRKIGVQKQSLHPALGKLPDLLQSLVQKKYLAESKVSGPDGHFRVYTVGNLALDEIREDNLKTFIDSIFKGNSSLAAA